jgi:hypothetical protein
MSDVDVSGSTVQHYVVEIDGAKHSEHACFVDAIKAGLFLHEQNPESKIKVRDLSESKSEQVEPDLVA